MYTFYYLVSEIWTIVVFALQELVDKIIAILLQFYAFVFQE
jgi:hypothetical protein